MSVTKRSIILAILFLIIAISIYIYSTMVGKKVVSDTTQLPTFIATDTDGAVYDENGGEEERVIRLPDGNQNYCHITEDETWFSKDTWGYIYDSQGAISDWDRKGQPEIYKLIHSTGNIYKYSEDGTQVLIK